MTSAATGSPSPDRPPRVRIAPSPTGDPHVGTAYIALFNYVFARKYGGQFLLRIEDTDQERSSASSEAAIFEALRWLGLHWDEGPDVGGPFGPYRQSERLDIYRRYAAELLERGHAYRCFATKDELEEMRRIQLAEKRPTAYDRRYRDADPAEGERRAAAGEPHVLRMKAPLSGETIVHDELRGNVHFDNRIIDDQVILKSDGFPTYHLANVVDDHLMGITHVIRGEEWISSTPKHVILYDMFGWEAPRFYHLGLLRNADKSKLSKRKNPVSVFHYRELGYLPSTFLNFLATLGFSISDTQERFSLDEMIQHFDWSRVSVGGPVFDPRKLEAFSGDDLRALPVEQLEALIWERVLPRERVRAMIPLAQERITRLDDFVPYIAFFFGEDVDHGPVLAAFRQKGRSRDDVVRALTTYLEEIEKDVDARGFTVAGLERFSREFCERHGFKPRELFTWLRLGVTGRTAAPPLFDTMALVGKDRARVRLRQAIERLSAVDWS